MIAFTPEASQTNHYKEEGDTCIDKKSNKIRHVTFN